MVAPSAPSASERVSASRWDVFCRVIDHFGDAGVCWRLARQLACDPQRSVRLWIDEPAVLRALVPALRVGGMNDSVQVEAWTDQDPRLAATPPAEVADVVIAAFACSLPSAYRQAMTVRRPVWINLEYLSAEDWVPRHHGLPSPKPDGLIERFFFPGFDDDTGGLLREPDLLRRQEVFGARERADFLASMGVQPPASTRLALLFCYPQARALALLDAFSRQSVPWRILLPEGVAPALRSHPLAVPIPFLPQQDFDALLWSCDLCFVRGEDSLVRALWAGRPLIWQAYRQPENAHHPKVQAFLASWQRDAQASPSAFAGWQALHGHWNEVPTVGSASLEDSLSAVLSDLPELARASRRWTHAQGGHPDLATRLIRFAQGTL